MTIELAESRRGLCFRLAIPMHRLLLLLELLPRLCSRHVKARHVKATQGMSRQVEARRVKAGA